MTHTRRSSPRSLSLSKAAKRGALLVGWVTLCACGPQAASSAAPHESRADREPLTFRADAQTGATTSTPTPFAPLPALRIARAEDAQTDLTNERKPEATDPAADKDSKSAASPELVTPRRQVAPIVVNQAEMMPAWTLNDLEALALRTNPTLERGRAAIAAAQGNHWQVGLPPNPKVGYSGQQLGSGGLAEQQGVIFEQEFVRRDKLNLNREAAGREVQRVRAELAAQEQRVLTDVRIAFFETLIAVRRIDLARELLRLNERSVETSRKLVKIGETPKHALLQAEIAYHNALNALTAAENRYAAGQRALAAVTGYPDLERYPLQGDPTEFAPELRWEDALGRILASSPELTAAVADVDRTRALWARASIENRPNFTVQGTVNAIDNGIGGDPDGALQIMLPVPLWNRNQGAIKQTYYDFRTAQRNTATIELDLRNRLAPVFERYRTTWEQAARYRNEILPLAQRSVELIQKGYEAGEFPYDNVLMSLTTYNSTNQAYLDAIRDHQTARAEIEGLLLKDSLSTRR